MKLQDIANIADVSIATVSRILNNDPSFKVKEETRERVIQIATETGYLKQRTSEKEKIIAIVQWIPSFQEELDLYYLNLRKYIEIEAVSKNYRIERYYVEDIDSIFDQSDLSAIICIGKFSETFIEKIQSFNENTVFVDSNNEQEIKYSVTFDFYEATKRTLKLLSDHNHHEIAYIGGREFLAPSHQPMVDQRTVALYQLMRDYPSLNIKNNHVRFGDFSKKHGYNACKEIISDINHPHAIICGNDDIAMGTLRALSELKLLHKISVVGFNDDESSKYLNPPLTTTHLNTKEMAFHAVNLAEAIQKNNLGSSFEMIIGTNLIIRESVFNKD